MTSNSFAESVGASETLASSVLSSSSERTPVHAAGIALSSVSGTFVQVLQADKASGFQGAQVRVPVLSVSALVEFVQAHPSCALAQKLQATIYGWQRDFILRPGIKSGAQSFAPESLGFAALDAGIAEGGLSLPTQKELVDVLLPKLAAAICAPVISGLQSSGANLDKLGIARACEPVLNKYKAVLLNLASKVSMLSPGAAAALEKVVDLSVEAGELEEQGALGSLRIKALVAAALSRNQEF